MIESADEFVRLRTSADPAEYQRAARDDATERTWRDVIARFPEMRFWVAQNKTVPPPEYQAAPAARRPNCTNLRRNGVCGRNGDLADERPKALVR